MYLCLGGLCLLHVDVITLSVYRNWVQPGLVLSDDIRAPDLMHSLPAVIIVNGDDIDEVLTTEKNCFKSQNINVAIELI